MCLKTKKRNFAIAASFIMGATFFLSNLAAAQKNDLYEIVKFIKRGRVNAAYAIGGANFLELNNLNMNLSEKGFPEAPTNYMSFGAGAHFVNNKLVIGVEFIKLLERITTAPTDYNISVSAHYILLNFGRIVYWKKGLMMYPFLGGGLGKLKMITAENNIDSFNDISGLQRGSEAKFSNFICNLGFATDYFLKYNPEKKGRNNLIIGFRAGINFMPFESDWKVNRIAVPDGPETGINGPYFRIIIGLGGWAEVLIRKAIH